MAQQFMTVCVLCLLCATHSQCSSSHAHSLDKRLHRKTREAESDASPVLNNLYHLQRIFAEFGDIGTMSMPYEGFVKMITSGRLRDIGLNTGYEDKMKVTNVTKNFNESVVPAVITESSHTNHTLKCLKAQDLFYAYSGASGINNSSPSLSARGLHQMCPALLSVLIGPTESEKKGGCVLMPIPVAELVPEDHEHEHHGASLEVWLCATGSILVVSLCGLLGVVVIPFMQKVFYHQLLQFLVALAVGTLCGDALLHLLPHAMLVEDEHSVHSQHQHDTNIWKGLIACLGIIFFFLMEKCLTMVAEWRKRQQRKRKVPARVRVMRDAADGVGSSSLGEKLCKHKYSSYPYCYGEITTEITEGENVRPHYEAEDKHSHNHAHSEGVQCCLEELKHDEIVEMNPSESESYTVIIREHENAHHGHSHTHGHVHSPPKTMSSVAWMVVMGDGLHNFTDGMAIGAAFAANVAGGFSTAIAVFCHELPHEIGDFAVLLKAGMSLKRAVFYNLLSSALCLFGMLLGVALGNSATTTPWVFAAAGGLFLYIALVDMIPELTSSHSKEGGSLCQCLLQFLGLITGTGIMLAIAIYEHDLKTVFTHD
ncbi:zinc transporter foi [Anabrus simplex]|uniref:zinc transporter foi n=1 Tax=Anabrus simplex TaxID=316456 RepID=UPI0035A3A3B6